MEGLLPNSFMKPGIPCRVGTISLPSLGFQTHPPEERDLHSPYTTNFMNRLVGTTHYDLDLRAALPIR